MISEKKITKEMGEKVAAENNMQFFDTSAKEGTGITDAFESIARDIIANMEEKQGKKDATNSIYHA